MRALLGLGCRFRGIGNDRLCERHVADQARMLVLLRRAAGLGDAFAVPVGPEAAWQHVSPYRSKAAARSLGLVFDVVFSKFQIECGQESTQESRVACILLFEEQPVIR